MLGSILYITWLHYITPDYTIQPKQRIGGFLHVKDYGRIASGQRKIIMLFPDEIEED